MTRHPLWLDGNPNGEREGLKELEVVQTFASAVVICFLSAEVRASFVPTGSVKFVISLQLYKQNGKSQV